MKKKEALELLDQARTNIETVMDEAQDALDNMTESLQQSECGEAIECHLQNDIQDSVCQFLRTYRFFKIGVSLFGLIVICEIVTLVPAFNICDFRELNGAFVTNLLILTTVLGVLLFCAAKKLENERIMLSLLIEDVEEGETKWNPNRSIMELRRCQLRRCRENLERIESQLRFVDIIVPLFIASLGMCYILFK